MKIIFKILICFVLILIGVAISRPNESNLSYRLQDRIDQFEDDITNPNADYESPTKTSIEPNIVNKIGNKVDGFIEDIGDKAIDFIKKMITD